MRTQLDDLIKECEHLHGHICPGQVLGVRMALLGCERIGISEPRGSDRKKLLVWVEIDRCLTDALSAVTGARLGRRSLKFVDYGKVAATFVNTETGNAVRVLALEESRGLADSRYPEIAERKARQLRAYREATDEELFKVDEVSVHISENDLPGRPRSRTTCTGCGESVNDGREMEMDGALLCRACANGGYYSLRVR
jgi:formylmethanofuran dehydrogenase subunit E